MGDRLKNAQGVVYWNAFYPGHFHVPENTAYPCTIEGVDCAVVIVRHHEPVVVTDFSNDLIVEKKPKGRHVFLKKPIPYRPENTISIDFQARGNPHQQHAVWTKDQLYQVYRKQSFTEITVAVECQSESSPESQDIGLFKEAVNRFLEIYRVAAVDPKAHKYQDLRFNSPTVRRCYVPYRRKDTTMNTFDRMLDQLPSKYPDFIMFSFFEFAEDAARLEVNRQTLAAKIGHHMAVGTQISESQSALIECFSHLKITKNFRYAVIDAFSVAEVLMFDLILEVAKTDRRIKIRHDQFRKRNGRVTVKDAIHKFLPRILAEQMKKQPKLVGDLDKCRKRRHEVAHERAQATSDDAEFTLNTTQQLIFAIEDLRGEGPST